MGWQRRQRWHTGDSRTDGAKRKTKVAFLGIRREIVQDGITFVSTRLGQAVGAGLVATGTAVAEVTGHHPSLIVAGGAAYVGAKVGSFVQRVVTGGGGGSPVDTVLGQLAAADTATVAAQNEAAAMIPALDAALDAFATVHGLDSKNPLAGRAMAQVRSARQTVNAGTRLLKSAQKHIETTSLTIMRGT